MAEWVSVKEQLPMCDGWYLVCVQGWATLAWFDSSGWSDFLTCVAKTRQVTHWMPLPEPPREDDHVE